MYENIKYAFYFKKSFQSYVRHKNKIAHAKALKTFTLEQKISAPYHTQNTGRLGTENRTNYIFLDF